jgi:hypothetical protein
MTKPSTKTQFTEGVEELDLLVLEKLHPLNIAQLTFEEIRQYKSFCHPLRETVKKRLFKEILYQSK